MKNHLKSICDPLFPCVVGWYEWCALPELNIPAIKAKMDTGARTSAIHAYHIVSFRKKQSEWVRFYLHPIQGNDNVVIPCEAKIIDRRYIMSSNGHKENRYVIQTALSIGKQTWPIELTLSNRDPMRFRLLLGREALKNKVIVDPSITLKHGKISLTSQYRLYNSHNVHK